MSDTQRFDEWILHAKDWQDDISPADAASLAWDHQQFNIEYRDAEIAKQRKDILELEHQRDGLMSLPEENQHRIAVLEAELDQRPEVSWEEDGEIEIAWYIEPSKVLSLSIGQQGQLSWAGAWGDEAKNGDTISPDLFQSIARFLPPPERIANDD